MVRLVLFVVGIFLAKISWTGELAYFIHPRHFWLIYASLACMPFLLLFGKDSAKYSLKKNFLLIPTSALLILASIFQFSPLTSFAQKNKPMMVPQVPASEYLRSKRATYFSFDTKQRTLFDWVTIQSFDPEPLSYQGQEVHIQGFYYKDDENRPMIAQYVLNCCAADARIIGMFLSEPLDEAVNTWFEVEGVLEVVSSESGRYLALNVSQHKNISIPEDPYVTR